MKLNVPPTIVAVLGNSSDGEPTIDVRHHIRYPLRAPVSFSWFSPEGTQREAKGNSRNIGEGGAYIATRSSPPLGAQIILAFRFRDLPEFAGFQRLEMCGQVIRIEILPDDKAMWGFAVASTWTNLLDREDSVGGSADTK
jgi:hypothetical protein